MYQRKKDAVAALCANQIISTPIKYKRNILTNQILTCAAITLWRSAINVHLAQTQSRQRQYRLWPFKALTYPYTFIKQRQDKHEGKNTENEKEKLVEIISCLSVAQASIVHHILSNLGVRQMRKLPYLNRVTRVLFKLNAMNIKQKLCSPSQHKSYICL